MVALPSRFDLVMDVMFNFCLRLIIHESYPPEVSGGLQLLLAHLVILHTASDPNGLRRIDRPSLVERHLLA